MVKRRHLVIGAVALVAWTVFIAAISHTHISSHPATAHHDEPIHDVTHLSPQSVDTSAPLYSPTQHKAHTTIATTTMPEKVPYEAVTTLVQSKHHLQLLMGIAHNGIESLLSPLPLGLECESNPSSLSLLRCGGKSAEVISSRDATIGVLNVSFGDGGTVTIRSASMGTYLSRDAHTHTITMDKVQAKSLEKWEFRKAKNDGYHLFGVRSNYEADGDSKCIVVSGRQLQFGNSKDCAVFRLHRPLAVAGAASSHTAVPVAVIVALTYRPLSKLSSEQQFSLQTSIQMWFAFLQTLRSEQDISAAAVFCMDDPNDIATIIKWASEVGISSDNITTDMTGWIVARSDCEKHPDFGNQPTYRGVFAAAEDVGRLRFADRFFILHSNSDIILDASSVSATLRTTVGLSGASEGAKKPILISGRRWNCDVSAIQKGIHTRQLDKKYLLKHCSLFGDNAQDYFIVSSGSLQWDTSRGAVSLETDDNGDRHVAASRYWRPTKSDRWNLTKHVVPPFVVGGIAFDNWFVSAMMGTTHTQQRGWVIDATAAVGAFHINHGTSRFASHRQPKSKYNLEMAHYCNGWAEGKVGVSPLVALHNTVDDTVLLHQRGLLFCAMATSFECEMPIQPPNTRRQNAFDGKWEAF